MPAQLGETITLEVFYSVAGVPAYPVVPAPTFSMWSPLDVALVSAAAMIANPNTKSYSYSMALPGSGVGLYKYEMFSSQADLDSQYQRNAVMVGQTYVQNLDAAMTTRAPASTALSTVQYTSARAGYLDNLNVGGAVASQADVLAINQSASRRMILATVGQYERPESGSITYTIEARTYDGDGAAANADLTPTLTPTGSVTGDLSANLSVASNPSTGLYRWTYTVSSAATAEQIRFDISATLSASTFTLSAYTQVTDVVSSTWTAADRIIITDIQTKIGTPAVTVSTDIAAIQIDTNDIQTRLPAALVAGRIDSSVGAMAADVVTAAAIATDAVTEINAAVLAAITALNNLSPAQINAEVVDVLSTDTHAEPSAPPTFPMTYQQMIMFLAAQAINKIIVNKTTGIQTLRNHADSADISTQEISDNGTIFIRDVAV